jgi:hypothetical protein
MINLMIRLALCASVCAGLAGSVQAQNQLSSGTGPGSVTLTVDGWGMFGGCPSQTFHSDAMYKNAAGAGPFATTCYSAILLEDSLGCPAPGRTLLALTDPFYGQFPSQATNPAVNVIVPGRHIQTMTPQIVCGLSIAIDQRLDGPDPVSGGFESSTLVQTYTITNTGTTQRSINLYRFMHADLSTNFSANRAGASRRLADCGLSAPYVSNREWAFEFDPFNLPNAAVAIAAEGVDDVGQPVRTKNYRLHASSVGHPSSAFTSNPAGFLNDTIDNDLNGDLVVSSPELTGDFAQFNVVSFLIPAGATISATFRTRWMSLDTNLTTPVENQAQDITCRTWNGNYSGTGFGHLLCVNGQGVCAAVNPGSPITISLAATTAGPSPADYLLFGSFGQPAVTTACGSPQAMDSAFWGPPFGPIGMGALPVSSMLASWTGGGTTPGIPLVSSVPGLALLTAPQASGTIGCNGVTIAAVPGLPPGISVTLQAVIIDISAIPLPATLSNAVNLTVGCGPCQVH